MAKVRVRKIKLSRDVKLALANYYRNRHLQSKYFCPTCKQKLPSYLTVAIDFSDLDKDGDIAKVVNAARKSKLSVECSAGTFWFIRYYENGRSANLIVNENNYLEN